jgi:hypothetical protein
MITDAQYSETLSERKFSKTIHNISDDRLQDLMEHFHIGSTYMIILYKSILTYPTVIRK